MAPFKVKLGGKSKKKSRPDAVSDADGEEYSEGEGELQEPAGVGDDLSHEVSPGDLPPVDLLQPPTILVDDASSYISEDGRKKKKGWGIPKGLQVGKKKKKSHPDEESSHLADRLQERVMLLEEENNAHVQALEETKEIMRSLEDIADVLKRRTADLVAENEALKLKSGSEESVDELNIRLAEARVELQATLGAVNELERTLDEANAAADIEKATAAKYKSELETALLDHETLRSQLEQANQRVEAVQRELTEAAESGQVQQLSFRSQTDQLDLNVRDLEEEVATLQKALAETNSSKMDLERQLTEKSEEIARLRDSMVGDATESDMLISDLKEQAQTLALDLKTALEELDSSKQELHDISAYLKEAENREAEAASQLKLQTTAYHELKADLEVKNERLTRASEYIEELEGQLQAPLLGASVSTHIRSEELANSAREDARTKTMLEEEVMKLRARLIDRSGSSSFDTQSNRGTLASNTLQERIKELEAKNREQTQEIDRLNALAESKLSGLQGLLRNDDESSSEDVPRASGLEELEDRLTDVERSLKKERTMNAVLKEELENDADANATEWMQKIADERLSHQLELSEVKASHREELSQLRQQILQLEDDALQPVIDLPQEEPETPMTDRVFQLEAELRGVQASNVALRDELNNLETSKFETDQSLHHALGRVSEKDAQLLQATQSLKPFSSFYSTLARFCRDFHPDEEDDLLTDEALGHGIREVEATIDPAIPVFTMLQDLRSRFRGLLQATDTREDVDRLHDELTASADLAKRRLQEAASENGELRVEAAKLQSLNHEISEALENANLKIEEVRTAAAEEIRASTAHAGQLEANIDSLQSHVDRLKGDLALMENLTKSEDELKFALTTMRTECNQLRESQMETAKAFELQKIDHGALTAKLKLEINRHAELTDELSESKAESASLKEMVSTMDAEVERLTRMLADLGNELDVAMKECRQTEERLTDEISSLRKHHDARVDILQHNNTQLVESHKQELLQVRQEVESEMHKLSSDSDAAKNLHNRLAEMERANSNLERQLRDQQTSLQQKETQLALATKDTRVDELQSKLTALQSERDGLNRSLQREKSELEEQKTRSMKRLTEEHDHERFTWQNRRQKMDDTIRILEEESSQMQIKLKTLRSELMDAENDKARLEAKLAHAANLKEGEVTAQIESLQVEVRAKNKQVASLEGRLAESRDELAIAEQKLSALEFQVTNEDAMAKREADLAGEVERLQELLDEQRLTLTNSHGPVETGVSDGVCSMVNNILVAGGPIPRACHIDTTTFKTPVNVPIVSLIRKPLVSVLFDSDDQEPRSRKNLTRTKSVFMDAETSHADESIEQLLDAVYNCQSLAGYPAVDVPDQDLSLAQKMLLEYPYDHVAKVLRRVEKLWVFSEEVRLALVHLDAGLARPFQQSRTTINDWSRTLDIIRVWTENVMARCERMEQMTVNYRNIAVKSRDVAQSDRTKVKQILFRMKKQLREAENQRAAAVRDRDMFAVKLRQLELDLPPERTQAPATFMQKLGLGKPEPRVPSPVEVETKPVGDLSSCLGPVANHEPVFLSEEELQPQVPSAPPSRPLIVKTPYLQPQPFWRPDSVLNPKNLPFVTSTGSTQAGTFATGVVAHPPVVSSRQPSRRVPSGIRVAGSPIVLSPPFMHSLPSSVASSGPLVLPTSHLKPDSKMPLASSPFANHT